MMQYLSTIFFLTFCFVTNAYALLPTLSMMTAEAQTPVTVSYATGNFLWDAPVGGSTPTEYRLNCGAADVVVPYPTLTKLISEVVPSPGTYTCTVKAANAAGVSPASNAVTFTAVAAPNAPTNLQVQ